MGESGLTAAYIRRISHCPAPPLHRTYAGTDLPATNDVLIKGIAGA